jgi:hypothetical protein
MRRVDTVRVGQGQVTSGVRTGLLLALAVLALGVAGCGKLKPAEWLPFHKHKEQPVMSARLQVVQRTGGQAANVTADDVVAVLRQIGLGNDQIVEFGPPVYEALRASGAAAMVNGKQTEILLAISDGYVWVQSRVQGSFIYDLEDHKIGTLPPMPVEGY